MLIANHQRFGVAIKLPVRKNCNGRFWVSIVCSRREKNLGVLRWVSIQLPAGEKKLWVRGGRRTRNLTIKSRVPYAKHLLCKTCFFDSFSLKKRPMAMILALHLALSALTDSRNFHSLGPTSQLVICKKPKICCSFSDFPAF